MRKRALLAIMMTIMALLAIAASGAENYVKGMIMGLGERLSEPQTAIMKVQLGASTQSGAESMGESVEPLKVTQASEKALFEGLIEDELMGPLGVSGAFIRKVEEGTGIWVASSNNDYAPLVFANAFYTAGIRDVAMSVSSIEPVPGMMALPVAVKAYEKLTGQPLSKDNVALAAEEILATAQLGKALEHYEMGSEVAAYAKDYAKANGVTDEGEILGLLKERVALYERQADDAAYEPLARFISKYAKDGTDRSDMQAQLATLRADQLWLVEPKERMMDEEELAKADEELQDILDYLDEEQKEPSFFQKNAGWVMAAGLVLVSAVLALAIAYFQTRPKGGRKGKK